MKNLHDSSFALSNRESASLMELDSSLHSLVSGGCGCPEYKVTKSVDKENDTISYTVDEA